MLAFCSPLAGAELSSRLQARGAQACRPTPPHVAPLISGRHQPSPVPLGPGAPSRLHCPNMSPQRAPRTEPCWPGRTRTAPLRRAVRVPREDEHTNCMTDPGRDRPAPGPPAGGAPARNPNPKPQTRERDAAPTPHATGRPQFSVHVSYNKIDNLPYTEYTAPRPAPWAGLPAYRPRTCGCV